MSFRIRKNIVRVLLVLVCLWPLAHFGIVHAFGLNPWKWFGWAMYTVPPGRVRANAYDMDTGDAIDLNRIPHEEGTKVLLAYRRFSNHRMEFGRRTPPDEFARAIFRAFPSIDRLLIQVQDVGLDRKTATITELKTTNYEYDRSEMFG